MESVHTVIILIAAQVVKDDYSSGDALRQWIASLCIYVKTIESSPRPLVVRRKVEKLFV